MKYLVTGGAGFIGSNIVHQLVSNGQSVRVLDDFSTGRRENLHEIADNIELFEGDIRDIKTVQNAVNGMDYVLHLAALPSVPRSVKDPITSNEVNITGTLNVLEASRQANVKKVVSSSSSSVYGDSETLPKNEGMELRPLSPYAVTKLTGEHYCRVYWKLYQLPTVSLRYFNIFGPNQNPDSEYAAVIPKFIKALYNDETPVVFGDGEQSRDFTYIDNAVHANLLAATSKDIVGTEFNVACGSQFTLNQLLDNLRELMNSDKSAKYTEPRPGDILHSYADISKFKKLGYNPEIDFKNGLQKTIEYFRNLYASTKSAAKINR